MLYSTSITVLRLTFKKKRAPEGSSPTMVARRHGSPAAWQSYSAARSPEPQTSTCKHVYTRPMLIRERTRALSPNLRARTTATTCMSAARPCSSQGTVREVNSSSTWLAHFVTRQECEEHDLRTRSTRRKPRSDLSGHGGPKSRRGRVSRNAAPTVAYYLECRFGKMKCEAAELRASWDELQLWRLRSSAVATSAMAKRRPLFNASAALGEQHAVATRCAASASVGPNAASSSIQTESTSILSNRQPDGHVNAPVATKHV